MADLLGRAREIVELLDAADDAGLQDRLAERVKTWDFGAWRRNAWLPAVSDLCGDSHEIDEAWSLTEQSTRVRVRGPNGDAHLTFHFDETASVDGVALAGELHDGIGNIVINCPPERHDEVKSFYGALLGDSPPWRRRPQLVFDEADDNYAPPRWPYPAYPQQMHLDLFSGDLDAAASLALARGGTLLRDNDVYLVIADPIGHPLCLCLDVTGGATEYAVELGRIVIDCAEAEPMQRFYEGLLGADVVPRLAFQQVEDYRPPQWPSAEHPQQIHFDIFFDDHAAAVERAESLGAVLQPKGGSCPVYTDPAGHPFCLCTTGG